MTDFNYITASNIAVVPLETHIAYRYGCMN